LTAFLTLASALHTT